MSELKGTELLSAAELMNRLYWVEEISSACRERRLQVEIGHSAAGPFLKVGHNITGTAVLGSTMPSQCLEILRAFEAELRERLRALKMPV